MANEIVIKGAREHNLKDVDLTIPRDELVVINKGLPARAVAGALFVDGKIGETLSKL